MTGPSRSRSSRLSKPPTRPGFKLRAPSLIIPSPPSIFIDESYQIKLEPDQNGSKAQHFSGEEEKQSGRNLSYGGLLCLRPMLMKTMKKKRKEVEELDQVNEDFSLTPSSPGPTSPHKPTGKMKHTCFLPPPRSHSTLFGSFNVSNGSALTSPTKCQVSENSPSFSNL
ncbi:hypothetical protein ACFX14_018709 [Malus domestica]